MWILLYQYLRIYSCRKNLLVYTNLFSLDDYKKNDKIIYKHFKDKYGKPWYLTEKNISKIDKLYHDLLSEKRKKVCRALDYFVHSLVFISAVSSWVPVSVFSSLVGVLVGTASSAVGLKIFVITAGMKKYKSLIKKIGKTMIKYYC